MRRAHTPGPWRVGTVATDRQGCYYIEIAATTPAGELSVAWIHIGKDPLNSDIADAKADAAVLAATPDLLGVVRDLCVQLASAGEQPRADSNNPLEALFARALAAHEKATGISDPFAETMAGVCADNRAALAARDLSPAQVMADLAQAVADDEDDLVDPEDDDG